MSAVMMLCPMSTVLVDVIVTTGMEWTRPVDVRSPW
jgi:hypothetical protein